MYIVLALDNTEVVEDDGNAESYHRDEALGHEGVLVGVSHLGLGDGVCHDDAGSMRHGVKSGRGNAGETVQDLRVDAGVEHVVAQSIQEDVQAAGGRTGDHADDVDGDEGHQDRVHLEAEQPVDAGLESGRSLDDAAEAHDHGGDHQGAETAAHAVGEVGADLEALPEEDERDDDTEHHAEDDGVVGDVNELHEHEDGSDEDDDRQEGGQSAGEVLDGLGVVQVGDIVVGTGDEVLTVTPYFVEYGSYVGNHGGTLKKVPTLPGTFGLDLPAIEAAITPKTRAMIINSPHNPTGTVYSREELEGLTAILAKASERNGRPLYLVVDEPYRFLAFDGVEVPSLLPMYPYAVLASSFSKNLCLAGERVGFIALSPLFAERAELMGGLTLANRILGFVNPPVVGQHIMAGALGSQVDVNIYARRREMMGNVLSDAGYEFQMPKGAFYFFPKAPGGDDVAFVNKLLDERILAVPGSGFGGPGHFRLAFCVEDEVIARSAEGFKRARG